MSSDVIAPDLGRFEFGIVKRKVRQLIGRVGFTRQDRESLEQELLSRLLRSLRAFDAEQAHRNVFVTAVVERDVSNILRDQRAEKRDCRRVCSLHETVAAGDGEPLELAATVTVREYDARRRVRPRGPAALSQLSFDLAAVMSRLPPDLRRLAEALKSRSISQIARETGIPRTTLNDRVRKIRRAFESAAMRDYL